MRTSTSLVAAFTLLLSVPAGATPPLRSTIAKIRQREKAAPAVSRTTLLGGSATVGIGIGLFAGAHTVEQGGQRKVSIMISPRVQKAVGAMLLVGADYDDAIASKAQTKITPMIEHREIDGLAITVGGIGNKRETNEISAGGATVGVGAGFIDRGQETRLNLRIPIFSGRSRVTKLLDKADKALDQADRLGASGNDKAVAQLTEKARVLSEHALRVQTASHKVPEDGASEQ